MGVFFRKYSHIFFLALFTVAFLTGGAVTFLHSSGNAVINEVCTSNVSCCEDEKGQYPDWIEIYNPTMQNIDLSGFIVNKSTDLKKEKFIIPEGTVLAPG